MRSVLLHGGASHYEVFILHSDLTDGDEADIRAALPDVGLHFVFVDPAMSTPNRSATRARSITASRRPCCCRTRSSASSISTRTRSSSTP